MLKRVIHYGLIAVERTAFWSLAIISLVLAFESIRSYWRVDHVGKSAEVLPYERYHFWDVQFNHGGVLLSYEDVIILDAVNAKGWLDSYRNMRGCSFDFGIDPMYQRLVYPTASGTPSDVSDFRPASSWIFALGIDWGSKDFMTFNLAARNRRWALVLPGWLLIFATAFWPLLKAIKVGVKSSVLRVRRREARCLACGYDMRASVDRCPECGRLKDL